MARSTFYYSTKDKPDKWATERRRIVELFHENKGRYGYRRLTMAMRNEGFRINGKTVRRLMAESGIKCEVRTNKYKSYKGNVGKTAPNLLNRNFASDVPYKKLVTDVTEIRIFGEKIYLSAVLDLFNGELICYTLSHRPELDMVMEMMSGTVSIIGTGSDEIIHTEQGWH